MKKLSFVLILTVLSVSFFTSCRQNTIKTIEKNISQKYYISPDTTKGSLNISLNVEIPTDFKYKSVVDSIRNKVIKELFGENYVGISNDSVVEKFANDLIQEYKLTNEPILNDISISDIFSFDSEHTLEGFTLLNDGVIYTYGINRYVFMGGAHGLNNVYYINFNMATGEKITEREIFVENYFEPLTKLLKLRIMEENPINKGSENMDETDFFEEAIVPNGNFYITNESINYIFNPYEIAPYYMGQTEVVIPFDRMKDMLKPNSVVSHMMVQKEGEKK